MENILWAVARWRGFLTSSGIIFYGDKKWLMIVFYFKWINFISKGIQYAKMENIENLQKGITFVATER